MAAVYPFAASNDVRYFLCGILIEPHEERGVYIVATNGHCIAVAHDPDGYSNGRHIVTISKNVLALCKKKPAKLDPEPIEHLQFLDGAVMVHRRRFGKPDVSGRAEVETELPGFGAPVISESVALAEQSKPIDGKFPDWQKVFSPSDLAAGTPLQPDATSLNPNYLAMLNNLAKTLDLGMYPAITLHSKNDKQATFVRFVGNDSVVAAVMRINAGEDLEPFPEWLHLTAEPEKKFANG